MPDAELTEQQKIQEEHAAQKKNLLKGGYNDNKDVTAMLDQGRSFAKEMESLPTADIIGGAFEAVVNAQWQTARTTIDFIESVGFEKSDMSMEKEKDGEEKKKGKSLGKVRMLEFRYKRPQKLLGLGQPAHVVKIPMLTLLPIPYLRVESLNIAFSVKLSQQTTAKRSLGTNQLSVESTNTETSGTTQTKKSSKQEKKEGEKGPTWREEYDGTDNWSSTSMQMGIVSTQSTNSQGMRVTREYSLKIDIQAVEDIAPAGLERMLDILTGLIGTANNTEDPLGKMIAGSIGSMGNMLNSGGGAAAAPGTGAADAAAPAQG